MALRKSSSDKDGLTDFPWSDIVGYGQWILALCALPLLLQMSGMDFGSNGTGTANTATHSLLEWTGVCAAVFVGLLAFLQYRLTDEPSLPVIGLAMFCAAGMDIFHTLAADGLVVSVADMDSFLPFTMIGSRVFTGLIMLVGVSLFAVWLNPRRTLRTAGLVVIGIAFAAGAWFMMDYCVGAEGLPRTIFAEDFIKRPLDLYPMGIFILCGVLVFPTYYRHHPTPFALALILSTLPQVACQLYLVFGSSSLHDGGFNIAHGMKALGYLVPAGGLLAELYLMFQSERKLREKYEFARQEAVIATRSKSEFLSAITQEIRSPMTGVVGMTDLLLGSRLSPEQLDAAETISGSANAVLALVEDVQDYSRLEAGTVTLEEKHLAPRRLVDSILDLLSLQAAHHNVRLHGYVAADVPGRVIGDDSRLRQILVKLASNALRHTRDGEVSICAELVEESFSSLVLRFHVRDTGAGLSVDKRVRILRSFSNPGQEDGSTYGGNGLGLAVTRQIVRLMGGSIWVESQVGEGTSFCFTIQLGKDISDRRAPRVVEEWQNQRVLLAVGSEMRATSLESQLGVWGFKPTVVRDAWDALREVRANRLHDTDFDLIILDEDLPGRKGSELCSEIRQVEQVTKSRLMLLTEIHDILNPQMVANPPWDLRLQGPVKYSSMYSALSRIYGVSHDAQFTRRLADNAEEIQEGNAIDVLIAEDDPINQKVLRKLLERLGCCVDVVPNGEQAADAVLQKDYEIVFMDCQMPVLDGFDATRLIRARELQSGKHTIVVAMTANARLSTRAECLQSGMDDYLAKPVRAERLAETLDRWKAGAQTSSVAE
jgi:signal transduction histidine kinase/CheY-like chemotaxis protein